MPRYAELIYNGFWFAPEREMLQAAIDKSQEHVEGEVRLKLYKGNVIVTGRESDKSLYSSTLVTFEDDKGAYDQKDAEGFIRLNALRLRTLAMRNTRQLSAAASSDRTKLAMFTRLEIGRIAGIPIYLDMMFVLVLLIFTYPYFTTGNTQLMSAGFIIVVGLLLSILLHELGHAFAGRLFSAHVSHIELTGLGGVAHFERSLPRSAFARSVIYLAGPAVNLRPVAGLRRAGQRGQDLGSPMLAVPLRRAGLGQLLPDGVQPPARLPARRRPHARCLARRHPGPALVGAHRRLRSGLAGGRRPRPARLPERHLPAARCPVPGANWQSCRASAAGGGSRAVGR